MNFLNWIWPKSVPPASPPVRPGILPITLDGSLQNPAWSPDGTRIVFTRFRKGYNKGPADVYIIDLATNVCHPIANDGSDNVSQPGATWDKQTGDIVFSSDRDGHDEIWLIKEAGGQPRKAMPSNYSVYEPSLSPDGQSVVCETHISTARRGGQIAIYNIKAQRCENLTAASDDCRQPNWAPFGNYILYQRQLHGQWEVCLYDIIKKIHIVATSHLPGDKTDATFSPDGSRILYSGQRPGDAGDGLLIIPVAGGKPLVVPHGPGYWGAASWSPDGQWIAAETSVSDPDGGPGTKLAIVRAP